MVAQAMICLNCGEPFTGHKRKWCSRDCRLKDSHIRSKNRYALICQYCGITYKNASNKHKYCGMICANRANNEIRSARTNPVVHCGGCGVAFKPRVNLYNKYCSRECAFNVLGKMGRERIWLRQMAAAFSSKIQHERLVDCIGCGCGVIVRRRGTLEMCGSCKLVHDKAVQDKHNAKTVLYTFNKRRSLQPDWICKKCGAPRPKHAQMYCSECRVLMERAADKKSKIARRYQINKTQMQTISDMEQFIRDGWYCQLCGCEVDQIPPYTKDNFAHLDHIIPLSKGGQHLWSNVQTLCRKCNCEIKNDKIILTGDKMCV